MITIKAAVDTVIVAMNKMKKNLSRRRASSFHVNSSSQIVTSSPTSGVFSMGLLSCMHIGSIFVRFCPGFFRLLQKHVCRQHANDCKADGIPLSSEVWYTLMTIMTKSTAMVAIAKVDAR